METWAWLAAFLVGAAVTQVYLYWHAMERGSDSGRGTVGGDYEGEPGAIGRGDVTRTPDVSPAEKPDAEEVVRCTECHAYNEHDGMFVYCRRCGEKL